MPAHSLSVAAAAPAAPVPEELSADGAVFDGVFYPAADGQPMTDNRWQSRAMLHAAGDLQTFHPDAFVAMDILLYYELGRVRSRVAPDVMVAFGVGAESRPSYYVWREGKVPDWVLEVASPRTQARDRTEKRRIYAKIGVPEFWLFDPQGTVFPRHERQLQGFRLEGRAYAPIPPRTEGGLRLIPSEVLGLDVRVEDELLRFRDAAGEDLRHQHEEAAALRQAQAALLAAERRAEREAMALRAAQARIAELERAR